MTAVIALIVGLVIGVCFGIVIVAVGLDEEERNQDDTDRED